MAERSPPPQPPRRYPSTRPPSLRPPSSKDSDGPASQGGVGASGGNGSDGEGEGDENREDWNAPVVVRFGTAIALAVLAAIFATGPAALRLFQLSAIDPGRLRSWCALAALAFLPMVLGVLVLRGARVGMRAFVGPGALGRASVAFGTVFAAFGALMLFGAQLRATTHNHALAGATFAIVGMLVTLAIALSLRRAYAIVTNAALPSKRPLTVAYVLALVGIVAFPILLTSRALASDPRANSPLAENIVDGLAFAIACLYASRRSVSRSTALAFLGPPMALVCIFVGVTSVRDSVPLRGLIRDRAPAYGLGVEAMGYPDPGPADRGGQLPGGSRESSGDGPDSSGEPDGTNSKPFGGSTPPSDEAPPQGAAEH